MKAFEDIIKFCAALAILFLLFMVAVAIVIELRGRTPVAPAVIDYGCAQIACGLMV